MKKLILILFVLSSFIFSKEISFDSGKTWQEFELGKLKIENVNGVFLIKYGKEIYQVDSLSEMEKFIKFKSFGLSEKNEVEPIKPNLKFTKFFDLNGNEIKEIPNFKEMYLKVDFYENGERKAEKCYNF